MPVWATRIAGVLHGHEGLMTVRADFIQGPLR
jgi:hypothetical protein